MTKALLLADGIVSVEMQYEDLPGALLALEIELFGKPISQFDGPIIEWKGDKE